VPPAPSGLKGQELQRLPPVAMPNLPRPKKPWRLYQGEAMKIYPTKELCLRMAEYHCETTKNERMMWDWLFCWGFYEMYIEEWF
jgi:hypothetical protein